MLKLIRLCVVTGVAIVLGAIAASLFQPIDQPCSDHSANAQTYKECEEIVSAQTAAEYTIWLTGFTGVLAIFTIVLAGASIWQGNISKRALTVLERPWLVCKDLGLFRNSEEDRGIRVVVRNAGRSPGVITSAIGGGKHSTKQEIDPSMIKMTTIPVPLLRAIVVQELESEYGIMMKALIDPMFDEIEKGTINLFNHTIITYRDFLDQTHETAFCVKYDAASRAFVEYGGPEYNYIR